MKQHGQWPHDELMSRIRELAEAERRRHASPRGSPAYAEAEADEEKKLELVWDLIQRAERRQPRR